MYTSNNLKLVKAMSEYEQGRSVNMPQEYSDFKEAVQVATRSYAGMLPAEQLAARDGFMVGMVALGDFRLLQEFGGYEVLQRNQATSLAYMLCAKEERGKREHDQFVAFVVGFTDAMQLKSYELPCVVGIQKALDALTMSIDDEATSIIFEAMSSDVYRVINSVAAITCGAYYKHGGKNFQSVQMPGLIETGHFY